MPAVNRKPRWMAPRPYEGNPMDKETKRPPGRNGGRGNIERFGDAFNFRDTATAADLQEIRRNYLARRHRLAPNMAAAMAGLAFSTREART